MLNSEGAVHDTVCLLTNDPDSTNSDSKFEIPDIISTTDNPIEDKLNPKDLTKDISKTGIALNDPND